MDIYYYFYNVTHEEENQLPIPGYEDSICVNKLDSLSGADIGKIFISVINANEWCISDEIRAFPNDAGYPHIVYMENNLEFIQFKDENCWEEDSEDENEEFYDHPVTDYDDGNGSDLDSYCDKTGYCRDTYLIQEQLEQMHDMYDHKN